jgi:hypothetical protein
MEGFLITLWTKPDMGIPISRGVVAGTSLGLGMGIYWGFKEARKIFSRR